MGLPELQLDSNLAKDTSNVNQPQGAVYASVNPSTPVNQPGKYPQTVGAQDVLPGTVLTSCILQQATFAPTVIMFGTLSILQGAGSPESVVVASPGSIYLNTSGGAGTTLYVKESGSGSTGWVGK